MNRLSRIDRERVVALLVASASICLLWPLIVLMLASWSVVNWAIEFFKD